MQRFIYIFCCIMIIHFKSEGSLIAPLENGVNILTGLVEESSSTHVQYEAYQPGINKTFEGTLELSQNDFRIGRIRTILLEDLSSIHFTYEPTSTSVFFQPDRLTKYSYSTDNLIREIEYYEGDGTEGWKFKRREVLAWVKKDSFPRLLSITIENEAGVAVKILCFHYDDEKGHCQKEETIVEGETRLNLLYDHKNRLERVNKTDPFNELHASYRYDDAGNKISENHLIEGKGSRREYSIEREFDRSNRLLSVAEGKKKTSYKYDQKGNLLQVVKPNGVILDYRYNDQGLLEEFRASDKSFRYLYTYDQNGNVEQIVDTVHQKKQVRSYDEKNELIKEIQNKGVKVGYLYNPDKRQIGFVLPDNSKILYHYKDSLLTSIERVGSQTYSHHIEYDSQGIRKSHSLINGIGQIDLKNDEEGHFASILSPWWSQTIDQRDLQGRILKMTIQDEKETYSHHYRYTEEGQLAEENGHAFAYDLLYNRIEDHGNTWEINALNQLIQTPEYTFVYDQNGNLIEENSKQAKRIFHYDALDRLICVEIPDRMRVRYIYDSFHRRIEQSCEEWLGMKWNHQKTEKFLYDGFKEIGKIDQEGKIVELRILDNSLGCESGAAVALELKGKIYVPIHDHQGSVRCLIDAKTGSIAESYSYTAFGEEKILNGNHERLENSAIGNPWRYCSKRTQEMTHLVFFGKREYNPTIGRWITPDPLLFCDTTNLYAFTRNDPLNCTDHYGLFSVYQLWDQLTSLFFKGFQHLQLSAHQVKINLNDELKLPPQVSDALEKIGKTLLGDSTYLLLGPHYEETQIGNYGEKEISDKVRITFINGILNTRMILHENLSLISNCHGGSKIHYVFRPTEGWTWDISRAIMIKTAFIVGFRSLHAHLLAQLWNDLIEEMGGVEGGGIIVHYAHSIGGSETDRARDLLSPEKQKMIRVITFGSSTLIRNEGFQFVVNHVSVNDGVSSIFLEPFGHLRNYFDPDSNVRFYNVDSGGPGWPKDHLLNGPTYNPLLNQLGAHFIAEFGVNNR